MKKLYYCLFVLLPFGVKAQATITSTQNGTASNPFTWDCVCLPGTDDNVIVNHNVSMDVDWLVNNGGSITVNPGGSFIQNGTHSIAVDGTDSELSISGQFNMTNLSVTNNAVVTVSGTGTMNINDGIYVGGTAMYTNNGNTMGADSLLTEGTFNQNGYLTVGNMLNTGLFVSTGYNELDSLGNTGTLYLNGGYTNTTAFGTTSVTNLYAGVLTSVGDMYNTGDFGTAAGTGLEVGGDFYSGDTINGTALFDHDGVLSVAGNLYFSEDVDGAGDICINGDSFNAADVVGTLDICDASATMDGFDLNVGNVAGTITFCNPGCTVGLVESKLNWNVAPNPTKGKVKIIGISSVNKVNVTEITGKFVAQLDVVNEYLDLSNLNSGTYFISLIGISNALPVRIIVE